MLFGASGATFPFANTYLTIYTTGTFFALMATGLNYFINCQGFPLVGMFTVLIGAGCNILSDPIFIFGFHILCLGHPYLYTDDHSAKLPVCLCRRADCPGMSKDRTCALRYQKISFCDQCSCPAFFLWCKSGFFRRTCC